MEFVTSWEKRALQKGKAEGKAEGIAEGIERGIAQGLLEGERRLIVRQGEQKFGRASAEVRAALEAVASQERLEALSTKLLEVQTWEELLSE